MWQNWVNVILGIWLIISPFILTNLSSLTWNNVIVGVVVGVLAYLSTTAKT